MDNVSAHSQLPPHIQAGDRVILFDGVCKLCNAWGNFIIRHDPDKLFKLCSVQSDEGQQVLAHFGLPTQHFETMLYVEGNSCYQRSEAFLRIVASLSYPWKLATVLTILPRGIRDWLYDRIALNRYRLFGKYDQCLLPNADHAQRFLGAD